MISKEETRDEDDGVGGDEGKDDIEGGDEE